MDHLTTPPTDHRLQSQIGPLTTKNILPLLLFFSAPQPQEKITISLDTQNASNPSLEICANDVLDIANQIKLKYMPEPSSLLQILALKGEKHDNGHQKDRSHLSSSQPQINSLVVHWSPNFPVKAKAKKICFKQENHSSIVSIGVVPSLENGEALLDSGTTHSVVGDISLFTHLSPTNMSLSVAS
ncbi:hypothetical protein O181_007470 [Austropuccinia psidii MF-1]|uniref:Uncharacterized protein n=1 Tax=Austropuccinia psidii MF-1 TaxID=1389203 RepID=A0A9Q3GHW9_9BASI|nr:hypothetical protein [Austropuccinia psidii MF-1]